MTNSIILSSMALLLSVSILQAQEVPKNPLPPSATTAEKALKDSPRHGEWVDIAMGDTKIKTWVVYPERKEKAGVVIVIHEIFGMTDWVRSMADALAAEGFIAVAPDLLSGMGPNGGGTDSLPNQNAIGQAIRNVGADEQAKRLDAVRDYAVKLPSANGKSGSIGFCWGGTASFGYAVHQPKLNAAVVCYGSAPMSGQSPNKDALAKITCPVQGNYGGNDARITATVDPTKAAMTELKKAYDPHVYDGAGHGFYRQQDQNDANRKAAEEGWKNAVTFLKKNLE